MVQAAKKNFVLLEGYLENDTSMRNSKNQYIYMKKKAKHV